MTAFPIRLVSLTTLYQCTSYTKVYVACNKLGGTVRDIRLIGIWNWTNVA